jgi:monoterpene epsilon-lactone hydrolase
MKFTYDIDGKTQIADLSVPLSDFASAPANDALLRMRAERPEYYAEFESGDVGKLRKLWDEHETRPALERARTLFPVTIEATTLGGIRADIVTPAEGVSSENRGRILINLHGGGFIAGAHLRALLEAVPIASVARIKVATLDYRLAPEHIFPAASEDIAAAYGALLGSYEPKNIGIYGCSAGGTLSAEAVAWFQKEKLPRPGAIAMICSNAARYGGGDSMTIGRALGIAVPQPQKMRWYFDGTDAKDPLVSPSASPATLSQFPPTLLISASRDFFLSHTTHFHLQLLKAGVEAQLCVWDGLWHGFVWAPELPESREVFELVAKFFARHLGAEAG